MNRFRRRLTGGLAATAAVGLVATQLASCAQEAHAAEPEVAVTVQPQLGDLASDLAEQCGLTCAAEGIAEGNASISGVASVDSFFQSVINFQGKALGVSAAIDAEVQAIRADFGIDAGANFETELNAQISANLEGGRELVQAAELAQGQVAVAEGHGPGEHELGLADRLGRLAQLGRGRRVAPRQVAHRAVVVAEDVLEDGLLLRLDLAIRRRDLGEHQRQHLALPRLADRRLLEAAVEGAPQAGRRRAG